MPDTFPAKSHQIRPGALRKTPTPLPGSNHVTLLFGKHPKSILENGCETVNPYQPTMNHEATDTPSTVSQEKLRKPDQKLRPIRCVLYPIPRLFAEWVGYLD